MHLVLYWGLMSMAQATEVDSFTHRNEDFPDATASLDAEVNRRLKRALDRANLWGYCDETLLYWQLGRELRAGLLGAYMISPLEHYSNYNREVARQRTSKGESMYQGIGVMESIPISIYPLGSLIRVSGHVIAGDKFSHFFNVGWTYYKMYYRDDRLLSEALDYGEGTERGIWGLATTGIYSYADLSANFQGMRFWARILGEEDILGTQEESYFRCAVGEWTLVRPFLWAEWIEASWDEGVNCNLFADRFEEKLEKSQVVPGLETVDFRECPVDSSVCEGLQDLYGEFSPRLLSPECLEATGE
jgi:hypothetical protein